MTVSFDFQGARIVGHSTSPDCPVPESPAARLSRRPSQQAHPLSSTAATGMGSLLRHGAVGTPERKNPQGLAVPCRNHGPLRGNGKSLRALERIVSLIPAMTVPDARETQKTGPALSSAPSPATRPGVQEDLMRALAALLVLVLVGCAGMPNADQVRQEASSGLTGCPPQEIAISDHQRLTWTATCKGRVFYCTAGDGTSCKERM